MMFLEGERADVAGSQIEIRKSGRCRFWIVENFDDQAWLGSGLLIQHRIAAACCSKVDLIQRLLSG